MSDDHTEAEQHLQRELLGLGFFYDFDGQPIGALDFEQLCGRPERVVARTEIGPRSVSTVWIGTDPFHAAFMRLDQRADAPPLIYETMILPDHEVMGRYATREQAQAGHDAAVTLLRATEDTQPDD